MQVSFERVSMTKPAEGEEPEEVRKIVKRTLFYRGNPYPQKKVLTFNRYSDDFSFQIFYGDLDFLSAEEKGYRLVETFVVLNFRYQALKAYFRGLIFVVCPEHVIIVAYYNYLDFRGLIFRFEALHNENNENFPLRY